MITWKDYIVQIAAYNNKGVGVFTEGAKIKTKEGVPESPPTNVKAKALNSTSVRIWWKPPDPQKINGINQGLLFNRNLNYIKNNTNTSKIRHLIFILLLLKPEVLYFFQFTTLLHSSCYTFYFCNESNSPTNLLNLVL